MENNIVLSRIPDQWTYRISTEQMRKKVDYVTSKMYSFLSNKSSANADNLPIDTIVSKLYKTDRESAKKIFYSFCTVVAQALLFKELHKYLFPCGRSNQLWKNSVLSKLAGKNDREMFFLMARNRELLNHSKQLA
jgi:hypothetical protein